MYVSKKIKLNSNSNKISTMIIGEVIGIFINNKFVKNNRKIVYQCVILPEWDIQSIHTLYLNLI